MGNVIRRSQCPQCAKAGADSSGDNLAHYDDGGSFCFACGFTTKGTSGFSCTKEGVTKVPDYKASQFLPTVSDKTCKRYQVDVVYDDSRYNHSLRFPLTNAHNTIENYHYRELDLKEGSPSRNFYYHKGDKVKCPLFGWQLVNNKTTCLIVCEGETDTLTFASQELPPGTTVVGAVGASFSKKVSSWLLSKRPPGLKEIVLAFDNDSAGRTATDEVVNNLREGGFKGSIRRVEMQAKDVKDAFLAGENLIELLEQANHASPNNILGSVEIANEQDKFLRMVMNRQLPEFSFCPALSKAIGFMPGSLISIIGYAGSGKSTLSEHIVLEYICKQQHVLFTSCEMQPFQVSLKLMQAVLQKPVSNVNFQREMNDDELKELKALTNKTLTFLSIANSVGTIELSALSNSLLELEAIGKKPALVVIDHFLAVVEDLSENSSYERTAKQIKQLAVYHNVCVLLLCHTRKPPSNASKRTVYRPTMNDAYGGGVDKWSDAIIGVARDLSTNITLAETVKLDRYCATYADVRLEMTDYFLHEVHSEATGSSPITDEDPPEELF